MALFRHYGKSYIYDRLHWLSVYCLMGLSGISAGAIAYSLFYPPQRNIEYSDEEKTEPPKAAEEIKK